MTRERVRGIAGYEGFYSVSDSGVVTSEDRVIIRSDGRRRTVKGRQLEPSVRTTGVAYREVSLWRDGKGDTKKVHSLVAEAFLGPRPEGADVCHMDGDPGNNAVSNLCYGTRSDNMQHSIEHGTHAPTAKTHCDYGHRLGGENAVRRSHYNGDGSCRSCANARSLISDGRASAGDFAALADSYYLKHTGLEPERGAENG